MSKGEKGATDQMWQLKRSSISSFARSLPLSLRTGSSPSPASLLGTEAGVESFASEAALDRLLRAGRDSLASGGRVALDSDVPAGCVVSELVRDIVEVVGGGSPDSCEDVDEACIAAAVRSKE